MKYFQSQEILTTAPPPVVKFSTTSGFALQRNYSMFFARHLYKFGKHCPKGTSWLFSCNISNPDLFISRADLFISGPDLVISGPRYIWGPDLFISGSRDLWISGYLY